MFKVQSKLHPMKVSIKEFTATHNKVKNRRGQPLSEGYIYRLIREDIKGTCMRSLWFDYILEGPKDRIFILV